MILSELEEVRPRRRLSDYRPYVIATAQSTLYLNIHFEVCGEREI